MYYLCKRNSERQWFNGNIIECKFFRNVLWHIGTKLYKLRHNSLRFCCDNNGLREIRKKVYSRKTSNQEPWTLSQALDFTKRKLEGDRPLGNSIGALLGSLISCCCEGEFELSDEESWELNGHTELTVERPYSGKHVIEVSVIRKATWWRLWKRKAVRICTFKKVNCSMTDVATIHFKQILERLGEKPQSVTKSF